MDWKKLLAYITGSVGQELLLRNEFIRSHMDVLAATDFFTITLRSRLGESRDLSALAGATTEVSGSLTRARTLHQLQGAAVRN